MPNKGTPPLLKCSQIHIVLGQKQQEGIRETARDEGLSLPGNYRRLHQEGGI